MANTKSAKAKVREIRNQNGANNGVSEEVE